MSSRPDLVAGMRVRVPLIIAIPIGALVVIGGAAFGFSRILLSLEKEAATAIALMMAANILIACAIVAAKPRMDSVTLAELFVVVTYPIVIGIVLAQIGFGGGGEAHGAEAAHGPAEASGGTAISAAGVAFDTDTLTLTAGEETTIPFENEDSVPHNLAIYEDDSAAKELFVGAEVAGGASADYEVPALDKGEYFFRCDLHPTSMTGTVTVE
jgi:plastocyanin